MKSFMCLIVAILLASTVCALEIETEVGVVYFPHELHANEFYCTICHYKDESINTFINEKKKSRPDYKPNLHNLCLICHLALVDDVENKRILSSPPILCTTCHGTST